MKASYEPKCLALSFEMANLIDQLRSSVRAERCEFAAILELALPICGHACDFFSFLLFALPTKRRFLDDRQKRIAIFGLTYILNLYIWVT